MIGTISCTKKINEVVFLYNKALRAKASSSISNLVFHKESFLPGCTRNAKTLYSIRLNYN